MTRWNIFKEYSQGSVRGSLMDDTEKLHKCLRSTDIVEVEGYSQIPALNVIQQSLLNAKICLTFCYLRGEVAAMFGVGWTQNPRLGRVWLLSSNYIYEVGKPFLRESPFFIGLFFNGHDVLFNHVYDNNLASIKWLKWLGFEATGRFPEVGPQKLPFTEYCKFSNSVTRQMYVDRIWPWTAPTSPASP